jgi:galactonate dehydratase
LNESLRIASLANAFSTNVTPHNCYGRLATRINAHFAALVPNCRIMEIEVDDVPWHTDLVAAPQIIEDGRLVLDDAPGWGCVVNEDAIRAHPVTPDPARPWLC